MTPLTEIFARRILASGPITLADFMAECLLHPEHGYYTRGGVIGARGDFVTAPEISQMFGELVGLSLAQAWLDQGGPDAFTLAELGPGRGTLMADVLRAGRAVPGFARAAQVHLVEASPELKQTQRSTLADTEIVWHETPGTLPHQPLFLVANEFFDALPIRQFQKTAEGWRETMVGVAENGALCLAQSPQMPAAPIVSRGVKVGEIVEMCPALPRLVEICARRIRAHGGVALFVDYGDWDGVGDTFQAVADHRPVDPLQAPGQADLTAHVNFGAIARAAIECGLSVSKMTTQGNWLLSLGIEHRARRLAANYAPGVARDNHWAAFRRLTDPSEMGDLFKVIGCAPVGAALPAGLAQ